jgi:UDP-N-acetylmuramate dehydrogenase
MKIFTNVPLKKYNTFGLNYIADCLIHIRNKKEAKEVFNGTLSWQKPFLIVGGGSNILFTSDFKGTILYPDLRGIKIEEQDNGRGNVIVSAGAGVNWDDFVEWTVNKGYGGLENLSLIPGKVGATPVQNIGAYGVEVNELIVKVETISTTDGSIHIFTNEECEFGYRNSIFKNSAKGKYLVTKVYYCLAEPPQLNLCYESLKEEVSKLGDATLKSVRQAVINIRKNKLPDPELIGNAGSFFKNTFVENSLAEHLKKDYPDMPVYEEKDGYKKLASGWLIDRCGWKGKRKGDAGVHDKQALVLINYGNATGKEIYDLSEEIRKSVYQKFGVDMEREAEIIGTI